MKPAMLARNALSALGLSASKALRQLRRCLRRLPCDPIPHILPASSH